MIDEKKLLAMAEHLFGRATLFRHNNKQELEAVGAFIIADGIVLTPMNDVVADKSNGPANIIREVIRKMPEVEAFIFWCESWMKGLAKGEKVPDGQVRDMPDRRETIMMLVETCDKRSWMCHAFIDNNQVGARSPWIERKAEKDSHGRLANWFGGTSKDDMYTSEQLQLIDKCSDEIVAGIREQVQGARSANN